MDKKTLKHLDLFSGYGGFTISAQKLGWETIGFSEIDKYACSVLNYHYPNIKNYGDITKIKGEDLPAVDIITGGSPCQDLSVAGKGAGLNGARSGLFFHFIRLIKEKQPMYFVWENVKGAFSSSKGWDFARVQIEMEQAGYDVFWQLLNAKDFGVPQNRERIFAIGLRKGGRREILFEQRNTKQNIKKLIDGAKVGSRQAMSVYSTNGQSTTLASNGGGLGAKTGLYAVDITRRAKSGYKLRKDNNVGTVTATYYKGIGNAERPGVAIPMRWSRTEKGKQARREAQKNGKDYTPFNKGHRELKESGEDVSGCITNALNKDSLLKQDMRIRRLTPTECERLMGLEDGWTAKGILDGKEVDISDTQRYKMCGNGVVVNCVDYIYNLIIKSYERRCEQGIHKKNA